MHYYTIICTICLQGCPDYADIITGYQFLFKATKGILRAITNNYMLKSYFAAQYASVTLHVMA